MPTNAYPAHLESTWHAMDGTVVTIRPIRPQDAPIEREFVRSLSPETRYMRFMSSLNELTPAMLARFTQPDYDREMALIAVVQENGREREVGVCRYAVNADGVSCEFAIVLAEAWQGRGLARHLMQRLTAIARSRGLTYMKGEVLSANTRMLELVRELGFVVTDAPGAPTLKEVTLALR